MKVPDLLYETLNLAAPAPGVVVVTLNRPDRYNAMTATMFDAATRGGYMSGGGYGGQHGRPMGRGHVEHDVYPLDGSVSLRVLDSALTDRLAAFTWNGTPGSGIFEFALTRSPAYAYKPTLP